MPKAVIRPAAPGFVRGVRDAVRGAVRAQTRAVIGLCGVCGINPTCARVHEKRITPVNTKTTSHVHVSATPHTQHTSASMRVSPRTPPRTASRTPRTATPGPDFRARESLITRHPKEKEVEMPAEEQGAAQQNIVFATGAADPLAAVGDDRRFAAITCGPENVQAFNARLRDELPEFHAFARELHRLGLIDGLRGARIGPVGGLGQGGVVPVLSDAAESRLAAKQR